MSPNRKTTRVNDIKVSQDLWLYNFESPDTHEVLISPKLISVCQWLIYQFGPIIITSGYRTPEHNKKVGGATRSYHLFGLAVDFKPSNPILAPLPTIFRVLSVHPLVGGLGIYEVRIIHLDLRPNKVFWVKPRTGNYRYFRSAEAALKSFASLLK